jgi:hypothetical protein
LVSEDSAKQLRSLGEDLQGHFGHMGEPIVDAVSIENVVHFHAFDPDAKNSSTNISSARG